MYDYLVIIICSDHGSVCLLKIKMPHPIYPSTRFLVQVPNIGIHFSPKRSLKIMELLNILYGTLETCSQPTAGDSQAKLTPWSPGALTTDCRILVWKVYPKIYVNHACLVYVNLSSNRFHFTGNWQLSSYMAALFSGSFWIVSLCF